MQNLGKIEVYDDDNEIIEILKSLPAMEDLQNLTILQFMQDKTVGADFGTVMCHEKKVYTIYKFDNKLINPEDAGLIMTKSDEKYAIKQLEIWRNFKNCGMSFSENIYQTIENTLIASFAVQKMYGS